MSSAGDGDFTDLTASADVATAARLTKRLEEAEARRTHLSLAQARARVAKRLGCSPGTLENLRRLRTKLVPHWLMARIRSAVIVEMQNEIRRLEHEIAVARRVGSRASRADLDAAEAALETARARISAGKMNDLT